MSQKLDLDWVSFLPLAPLRFWAFPKQPLSISPFEFMCGCLALTPQVSQPNPHLSLITYLLPYSVIPALSMELYRLCANPCSSPVKIEDQVLVSSPDQCPSPLPPKLPFQGCSFNSPQLLSLRVSLIGFTYPTSSLLLSISKQFSFVHINHNRTLFP